MTNHTTHFDTSGGGLALNTAILLYQAEGSGRSRAYGAPRANADTFASIHPVEADRNGRPTIGAGTPLTRAHLRQWAEALDRTAPPEILPETVLVSHPDILVWWVPAQVRSAYFALASSAALQALSKRTVVPVPYPAHLFIATRSSLGVYALARNERPTADTAVLHSPILNVYLNGHLCWGNIPQPKMLTASAIPEYERAVFDSWSTHPNAGQERTVTGKGGLVGLWDDLAHRRARRFPVSRLKPFTLTPRAPRGRTSPTGDPATVTVGKLIAMASRR